MKKNIFYVLHTLPFLRGAIQERYLMSLTTKELKKLKQLLQNFPQILIISWSRESEKQLSIYKPSLITIQEWLEKYQNNLVPPQVIKEFEYIFLNNEFKILKMVVEDYNKHNDKPPGEFLDIGDSSRIFDNKALTFGEIFFSKN